MERRFEDLNIEAVCTVKDEATGRGYTLYQKKCYHCGDSFLSRKSNAMGCSHDHANSIRKHRKRNEGQPKLVFRLKLAKEVDFSLKKYDEMGATTKKEATLSKERAKQIADFNKKADEDSGLGMGAAPHDHYRAARNIIINYYNRHGFKKFEALQELAADKERQHDSFIVDVGFIDAKTEENMVAVEVVNKFSRAAYKPGELLLTGFKEVLVYNYLSGRWHRHTLDGDDHSSKSEILGIDLAEYVELK